uniref:SERPIN domain-containing protein n=1 Tax=Strongyloides papillosus TaxID=174720 RepID=A0A0N5B8F7_STREA
MDRKNLLKLITSACCYRNVILTMLKFRVESLYSMKKVLTKMGLVTPFNDKSNFTGITSNVGFWFENIVQKVFIDVNEKGTKVEPEIPSIVLNHEEEIIVKANHPFLYIVLDNEKILFSGIYQ